MPAIFTFGGATAKLLSLNYVASVGITPQIVRARVIEAAGAPPLAGDLTFGVVGEGSITLRDCHLAPNGFRGSRSRSGRVWDMAVMDRRWKWVIGPAVYGEFNQRDQHNKLIPWTVRTPYQLASLCLQAMGETSFTIDLPKGLAHAPKADPANAGQYLIPPPGPGDVLVDDKAEFLALRSGTRMALSSSQPVRACGV